MINKSKINKPIFFLFTCIRDGNNYVDKLFNSLLNQTKINFVHYIYEDGSTMPLGNKISEYKKRVEKLPTPYKVIYEYNPKNIGLNMATQHCISKCECPYFIWIDCDNWVDNRFFEELENIYNKNKNATILRTVLYDSSSISSKKFNCGSIEEAKKKKQLGLFIRRRYYYSFFAVNYKKYLKINPKNIMLNTRSFYNDEQILLLCLLGLNKTAFSDKAIGYFTTREDQESVQYKVSLTELKEYQLQLLENVDLLLKTKLEIIYQIKDLYEELNNLYTNNAKESLSILKKIKKLSKDHKINLNMFYDSSLLKYKLRIYYWKFKGK